MKNVLKKSLVGALTLSLVFSTAMPSAFASGKHSTNSLFDFHTSKDEATTNYNSYTEEEKKKNPISNVSGTTEADAQRMIIVTKKALSVAKQKELLGQYGTYSRPLTSVIGFSSYVSEKNLEKLLLNEDIKEIYVDSIVTGQSNGTYQPTASQVTSADVVWEKAKVTGSGVSVAVLDTGVSASNKDVNVVAFKDFVKNKTNAYDDNGHGTHVAGIIAGSGANSNGLVKGIAPKTNIVGVKVLDSNEKGYISNVISGIDWVIENKERYNIKVINLSLGMNYTGSEDPLMQAVDKANDKGILVVAASGNNGNNGTVMSPAASPDAIAVGGSNANYTAEVSDDTLASFSVKPQQVNGVTKPEIYATGQNVVSTLSYEGNRARQTSDLVEADYIKMSGTSMSAPQVSGVAALLFAANPNQSPEQVKSKIVNSGINVKGLNHLNAATAFGLTPSWTKGGLVFDKTQITEPSKPSEPENKEEAGSSFVPPVLDELSGKPLEKGSETSKNESFVVDKGEEKPKQPNIQEEIPFYTGGNTEGSSNNSNNSNNQQLTTAVIPEVEAYQINNGFPFVQQTYKKENALEKLISGSKKYENQEEIEYNHEKIKEIIMLYNLMNRAFTKEDFLYFEKRLNSEPKRVKFPN